nr:immunoglobulin heavy chain junction region [Mus musculus]MBK4187930.1 immunoglobulin heavy chain junction region [Mus musculus]MBK4187941.1 immunoglobulin heavy chain junction region [Mus musculus]MBK4187942.1 immunoglobulin heavy chain junction region [Mus musculus]
CARDNYDYDWYFDVW